MSDTIYPEWRNVNANRDYPFSDGATLQPSIGVSIPQDAFLDAVFYPIGVSGLLYLSKIDRADGVLTISDDAGAVGTGIITSDVITFTDELDRPVGTLVTGPGFDELSSLTEADETATRFAAACVFPQNQQGLRGFLLPDGTLVTGDVTLAGEDGVRVDTVVESGRTVVRVQAVGVASQDDCIDLPAPVKCLKVKQAANSTLTLSQSAGSEGVTLTLGSLISLSDVCPDKNIPDESGNLPLDHGDFCDEEDEQPGGSESFPGFEEDCPEEHNGRYFLVPATSLLEVNPDDLPGPSGTFLEGADIDQLQEILDYLPPRAAQAIVVSVRGY